MTRRPTLPPELLRLVEALARAREERDYRAAQSNDGKGTKLVPFPKRAA